jgi:hypothetical protein
MSHDWNVLANTRQVTMPVGHILVGDAGGDVEHDDGALALDAARGNHGRSEARVAESCARVRPRLTRGTAQDPGFGWMHRCREGTGTH